MLDWNDLKYFLAVAQTGSTAAAARRLGVNQTTVSRRIAELERGLGVPLFERRREGYQLRPTAAPLVAAAERVRTEAETFEVLAGALGRGMERLKVTTNEPLANTVLAPAIAAFRARYPQVRIEFVISQRQLDLSRGEADLALRAAPLPPDPDLISRRVGEAMWGVYCSRDYARYNGAPATLEDLKDHTVLMIEDASGRRLGELAPGARSLEYRHTANELCIAARAGLGVVSLPCVLGETLSDLQCCFVQPEPATPIWLLYHARLRGAPEVRVFLDCVAEEAHKARELLAGPTARRR